MKIMKRTNFTAVFVLAAAFCLATAGTLLAQPSMIDRSGKNAILKVDGKPYFMMCGELHNSTSSSIKYLEGVWDGLKALNLNSVIASASWELVEPHEGVFDFSLVDAIIKGARDNNLKVCLIWFGTFKNPFMSYAPEWVKTDPKRFPRAVDENGSDLEHPTLFDEAIINADKKAYTALLKHIRETDSDGVVIMMQIGNEPGLSTTSRDFSKAAQKAWKAQVPKKIINYMTAHKGTMQPDIERAWEENGYKIKGDWETVFGKSITKDDGSGRILRLTEHLFTAYAYANYLEELSSAGKAVYDLPVCTNATGSVHSRGRSLGNGCAIPDFFDIYMSTAPSLDILTPNSYSQQLDKICEAFSYNRNPIMVPESGLSGIRPLYLLGEWDAMCFSPFGIDHDAVSRSETENLKYRQANSIIHNMWGLISANLNSDRMRGVYIYQGSPSQTIEIGDYQFTFNRRRSFNIGAIMAPVVSDAPRAASPAAESAGGPGPAAGDQKAPPLEQFTSGALILQVSDNEFYIVGSGLNADIRPRKGIKYRYCDYASIYEGSFEKDQFIPGRLLNGDEQNAYLSEDSIGVIKVKMYYY